MREFVAGLKVLILLAILFSSSISYSGNLDREFTVFTGQASLWQRPGLTYKDCIGFDNINSLTETLSQGKKLTSEEQARIDFCQVFEEGNPQRPLGENTRLIMKGGDRVLVSVDEKGEPTRYIDEKNGEFIRVHYPITDPVTGKISYRSGWVEAGHMSKIVDRKAEEEVSRTAEPDAPSVEPPAEPSECSLNRNEAEHCRAAANDIQNHLAKQPETVPTDLGSFKSGNQLRNYLCIYRDFNISIAEFQKKLPNLEKAATAAETAFGIPKEMSMCTMLVEGGLYHHPEDKDLYQGALQFGEPIVRQLFNEEINAGGSFHQRWKTYQKLTQASTGVRAEWTDNNIRKSSSMIHVTGAAGLMMRWIYEERINGCKDCSKRRPKPESEKLNRRDMYMMIAGFNWSPYRLEEIYNKPLWAIKHKFPPPRETRNYILAMERCMDPNQYALFRPPRSAKTKESSRSLEYKNNHATCNKLYPKE
jgi:hypothetical protein